MSVSYEFETWFSSTMNQDRFNVLALMHINNDLQIDDIEIVNHFVRTNKARMAFKNILDDDEK